MERWLKQNLSALLTRHNLPSGASQVYSEEIYNGFFGATAFVIAHEIGHHFLKHTKNSHKFMQSNRRIPGFNVNHEWEFAADAFALNLMFSNKDNEKRLLFNTDSPVYFCGPVIAFLAIACGDNSPCEASESHPSIRDRYLNMMEEIKKYCGSSDYTFFNKLVSKTQSAINKKDQPWGNAVWWK
ncbi:ImmA/IrrE family metallo-endopeptidase [Paenibacillus sp. Soil522]|uniref:ImmA/IrrE family metallo-endopeptidase n=1 Tax=Paenibacillus sp. Soil522 TaxID=1736388 RepID=UPI000B1E9D8C|nr:ImmA/IrrE family metallo-endopeptidase [Paenibacillus sp. Soil522]